MEGARKESYLDGLPPENEEGLGSLCQEAGELVHQDTLNLVRLLDLDAYAHAVDRGLDEHALVLVARNRQWSEKHLGRCLGLNLGDIVALSSLGGEVGEAEGGRETAPDSLEVRSQRLRLERALR
jgi:hypothetical protein